MNCVLYARVSTDKQADLSIPAQLAAMRAYAHQRHWLVAEVFVEPGASAKTTERPALQRLLARLRNSKLRTDVVVVHKIDRLARNVYDHATIKAMLKQYKVQLASVVENVDDTVPGQLVENIMASIAQFYSANLSEEVKKGMRQKVLRGGWPHLPPRGYISVKNRNERGAHVEVHPRVGPLIATMFTLYATGNYSLRALAERVARDGLRTRTGAPIPQSNIRRILTNPFYTGKVVWGAIKTDGHHPPLVSPEIFRRVQQLVQNRFRYVGVQGSVKGFPMRGTAICAACRGRMTAERHDRWGYYRCSRQTYKKERCRARFSNAARAHEQLRQLLLRVQITKDTANGIRKAARNVISGRCNSSPDVGTLQTALASVTHQEHALTRAFSAGDVTASSYRVQSDGLRERRKFLQTQLNGPPLNERDLLDRVDQTLAFATSIWDLYAPMGDLQRSQLLRIVFETIVLAPEGIIGFALNTPFDQLRDSRSAIESAESLVAAVSSNPILPVSALNGEPIQTPPPRTT